MARTVDMRWLAMAAALALATPFAQAADGAAADGCSHFAWDVSHELTVMKQTPQPVSAATKVSADVPLLQLDKVYELKLAPQASVTFAVKPGKPTLEDSAAAGLVHFRADKPGRYRVSITSGHWLDVVADQQLIKSRDFTGSRECERPHKIVEYELPAAGEFTLQFSGSTASSVILAITPVKAAPAAN